MRKFQQNLSLRLLAWAILSIVSGLFMLRRGKFWRGVGTQFIAWGAIDAMIAIGGQVASENRLKNTLPEDLPERIEKDKQNMKVALWVNTGLDVLYMVGGIRWMDSRRDEENQRGNGIGVLIQGTFLFFFDLYHSIKLEELEESND